MENLYAVRAYRWNESKYELTEPYLIAGNSKDEARDSLVAYLGDGWKASEAFEAGKIIVDRTIQRLYAKPLPPISAADDY